MGGVSRILLGLGTNLGDRRQNLRRAIAGLKDRVTVTAVSPVYETEPWGIKEQPPYLNICLAGTTALTPHAFLEFAKTLESRMGRRPTVRWGPRLIDIDLLFYDDLVLQDDTLTVPHPRLTERAFVLAPLADIAPDLVHPQTGQTVADMLAAVDTTTARRLPQPLLPDREY